MSITYADVQKCIKKNKPTDFYPDKDDFDDYDDYKAEYEYQHDEYMEVIATKLGFDSCDTMLEELNPDNPEDAEYDCFNFFYDNMVNEDYYDSLYCDDDDYDYSDNDYSNSDYDY